MWRRAWHKPLFANTQLAVGVAATAKLERYIPGAWRTWSVPGSAFVIEKVGKGISVEVFCAVGSLAQQIRAELGIVVSENLPG